MESVMFLKSITKFSLILPLFTLLPFQTSYSADKFWSCSGIDYWDNANCWNPVGQPTNIDNAYLTQNDSSSRTVLYRNSILTPGYSNVGNLTVDATGSGSFMLQINQDVLSSFSIDVGLNGTGSISQLGGAVKIDPYDGAINTTLTLGGNSTGNGTYNLHNGEFIARETFIGEKGTGTFNMYGGSAHIEFFYNLGVNGTFNLSGGSLRSVEGGTQAGSVFNQSGGYYTMNASVGSSFGGFGIGGTYNLSGGTLNNNGSRFRLFNTATFNMTGGVMLAGPNFAPSSNQLENIAGDFNLSGGHLYMEKTKIESSGSFNFTGGTLTVEQFTGDLHNNGGTVSPGTYQILGTGIAPDPNTIGATDVAGDYSQSALGTLAIDIGGTGTDEFDFMDISGTAILDGILEVSLFDLGSGIFSPSFGDSFDILFADTIIGQFDELNLAHLDDGLDWGLTYILSDFSTDIVRLSVISSPVPLPPAFWMFGSGLVGLIGIARRKNVH